MGPLSDRHWSKAAFHAIIVGGGTGGGVRSLRWPFKWESRLSTRDLQDFVPVDAARLEALLARIPAARIAVVGDFCLDIYWFLDMSHSERSVETGLMTRPVREQRCSLGGAGNIVNNLIALGCRSVHALGVIGDDPWGREQVRLLEALGVDTAGMLVQADGWTTLAYNKPHVDRQEQSRLDFGNFNVLSDVIADALLDRCQRCFVNVDVVIINQQVLRGIHSEHFRAGLAGLIRTFSDRAFVVDSRHRTEAYLGAVLKLNEHEAARLHGLQRGPVGSTTLPGRRGPVGSTTLPGRRGPVELILREEALEAADALFDRNGKPVVLTRGQRGLVVRSAGGLCEIPGIRLLGPLDTVGAGDSVLAGLAISLAIGCSPVEAAQLGNYVAGVTVQKLNETGTATPEEVLAIGRDCNYV